MLPIQTILCATDFSEASEPALQTARGLARDHGARLIVLSVAPPLFLPEAGVAPPIDLDADRYALEQLRGRLDGTDLKAPVQTELRQGNPAEEILHAAHDLGADLIVVGSHGRGALGRMLLGSVAEQVLRHAQQPVLIVKGPTPAPTPTAMPAVPTGVVF